MKLLFTAIILLAVVSSFINADDLKTKDGKVIKNITIVDSTEYYYSIQFPDGSRSRFRKDLIEEIVRTDGTILKIGKIVEKDSVVRQDLTQREPTPTNLNIRQNKKTYPNLAFLTVTALSSALAIDLFSDIGDINKSIDLNTKSLDGLSGTASRTILDEIDRLKGRKITKTFLGVISLIIGVVSTVYALAPVEVTAGPNQVAVNYRNEF